MINARLASGLLVRRQSHRLDPVGRSSGSRGAAEAAEAAEAAAAAAAAAGTPCRSPDLPRATVVVYRSSRRGRCDSLPTD